MSENTSESENSAIRDGDGSAQSNPESVEGNTSKPKLRIHVKMAPSNMGPRYIIERAIQEIKNLEDEQTRKISSVFYTSLQESKYFDASNGEGIFTHHNMRRHFVVETPRNKSALPSIDPLKWTRQKDDEEGEDETNWATSAAVQTERVTNVPTSMSLSAMDLFTARGHFGSYAFFRTDLTNHRHVHLKNLTNGSFSSEPGMMATMQMENGNATFNNGTMGIMMYAEQQGSCVLAMQEQQWNGTTRFHELGDS